MSEINYYQFLPCVIVEETNSEYRIVAANPSSRGMEILLVPKNAVSRCRYKIGDEVYKKTIRKSKVISQEGVIVGVGEDSLALLVRGKVITDKIGHWFHNEVAAYFAPKVDLSSSYYYYF